MSNKIHLVKNIFWDWIDPTRKGLVFSPLSNYSYNSNIELNNVLPPKNNSVAWRIAKDKNYLQAWTYLPTYRKLDKSDFPINAALISPLKILMSCDHSENAICHIGKVANFKGCRMQCILARCWIMEASCSNDTWLFKLLP